jgi:predicted MFS family arabinose efflux permease
LYIGFALLGVAKAGLWMIPLPLTAQFGHDGERPYYIGLGNTLIAPAAIVAPLLGGALADAANFDAAFLLAVVAGILCVLVLLFVVKEPKSVAVKTDPPRPIAASTD